MSALDSTCDLIEALIQTSRDAERGLWRAAQHIKDPNLRKQLLQESGIRRSFATQLEREAVGLGAHISEKGSILGAVHQQWINLKGKMGLGDRSIISSVKHGEEVALCTYAKALASYLPPILEGIIENQSDHIQTRYQEMRRLRISSIPNWGQAGSTPD